MFMKTKRLAILLIPGFNAPDQRLTAARRAQRKTIKNEEQA
jgi:hypothetical protein